MLSSPLVNRVVRDSKDRALPRALLDKLFLWDYSTGMDAIMKSMLAKELGSGITALLKVAVSRPRKKPEEEPSVVETTAVISTTPSSRIALPTSEETTTELKRRLGRELYRAELDLAAGLKIAGKPCDCLSNKHTLMLEAAAEELISQDPGNPVYQEIIDWIPANRSKVTPEAILSGQHSSEYPHMANQFKSFRKQVMGSVGNTPAEPTGPLTLAQAKKMAAEEAAKEVERAWKMEV